MFVYNATTDADKLSFTNCTFENADNTNFYYYYFFGEDHDRLSFTNCVFRGSYNGVELSSGNVSASFTGCSFINNSYSGIYLNPDGQIAHTSIRNSNLVDNGTYAIQTAGCCSNHGTELDMRYNYWGEAATAEMNEGNNPKNISVIRDWWDNDELGPQVNYAGWVGGSGDAGYTADVVLTDSEYNDIGAQYSIGTETVYVEVYDPDITGSLDVVFTSDTDVEGETVTLAEDATDVGYFRGSLAVSTGARVLVDDQILEDRLPGLIEQVLQEHPEMHENATRILAYKRLMEEVRTNPIMDNASANSREDGVLSVVAGDVVTVTYNDVLNDYGEAEVLTDGAVYGGVSGEVSGTWTLANSPYVITGDITVPSEESLTIEAGVEVRFFGSYLFDVNGDLTATGTEQDSIYFVNHIPTDVWAEKWQGIDLNDYSSNLVMSYVSARGVQETTLYMYNIYSDATISIDNSRFEGESYAAYLMFVYNATTDADKLSFTNCTFEMLLDKSLIFIIIISLVKIMIV